MLQNYLKLTWKVLGRNKFFTFVSLFGITFTIGILLVLTTFYENMVHPGAPDVNRDRTLVLVSVSLETEDGSSTTSSATGFYFYDRYIRTLEVPERIGLVSMGNVLTSIVGNKKVEMRLKYTCENFWYINEFDFLEGKGYEASSIANREQVAVITEATRDAYFGPGVSPIDQLIEISNLRYRVIGLIKNVPASQLTLYGDVFVPYATAKQGLREKNLTGEYVVMLMGKDQSALPDIKAEFASMLTQVVLPPELEYDVIRAQPLTLLESLSTVLIGGSLNEGEPAVGQLIAIGLFAMLLFMLLPALNLVNLNTSRIMERASEIGVRKAFGATSATLAVQFVVENVVLTLLGGILGFLFALLALELIESSELIPHLDLHLNFRVFLTALLLCLFFGFLSGVLPALRMSRLRIVNALKAHHI